MMFDTNLVLGLEMILRDLAQEIHPVTSTFVFAFLGLPKTTLRLASPFVNHAGIH